MFRPNHPHDTLTATRQPELFWCNGEFTPAGSGLPDVLADLPTPAVVETVRCYATSRGPALFRLRPAIERFVRRARAAGLSVPYTADELAVFAHRAVWTNGFDDCLLMLAATDRLDASGTGAVMVVPVALPAGETGSGGGTLFAVRNGVIYAVRGEEDSAAADTVRTLARDCGVAVAPAGIGREEAESAEEAFLCTPSGAIVRLRCIGPDSVADRLSSRLAALLSGHSRQAAACLEHVSMSGLY